MQTHFDIFLQKLMLGGTSHNVGEIELDRPIVGPIINDNRSDYNR